MKKSYKFKVIPAAGDTQIVDIASATGVGSTITPALAGAQYQLIDTDTGLAPDNIRATRKGSDLHISFAGRETADLVIADFYTVSGNATPGLMGELQSGIFHPYIPESGEWARSVSQMSDGMSSIGMALGGDPLSLAEFAPAALMPMAAAGGVNPLMAAPLALLGLAGGGGGAAVRDSTPPSTPTAAPTSYADNVGAITSAASTASFTDDTTPGVFVGKNLTDAPNLYVDGKKVTATYDAANGTLTPDTPLTEGAHALAYTLTNTAGKESGISPALNITVDTLAPASPTGALYGPDDTGQSATDGITGNNIPRIAGVTEPNATVKITINDHDYVGQADNQGRYLIQVTNALPNTLRTYKVQATDAAGNMTTTDGTTFTVDASNVSTSQGVSISIDAITQDTGVSQSDFITGDNTVVWRGTLVENNTAKFNEADWLQLQWVNAQPQTVATEYIKPTLTAGVWNWTWPGHAQALADGVYTLNAQLVDTAGNVLSATPWATTQSVTIDTQAQQLNGARDTNAGLSIGNIKMTALTDTGISQTDFVTNNRQPIFTGKVTGESAFNVNTGRMLAEVIDSTGKVVVFQYLAPSATGDWTFDNTTQFLGKVGEVTTYSLKTATVDMAGHFMNATSQAFTVDLKMPVVSVTSSFDSNSNSSTHYTQLSFSAGEPGVYIFNDNVQTGTVLNLGGVNQFAAGNFKLMFRDTAGNEQLVTNDNKTWDLSSAGTITLATGSTGPGGFGAGQLVGSVGPVSGKYELLPGETLDLSTLYTLTPTLGANGGLNHIVMGAGAQTLTVSVGDVLQLGMSNSFSNDAAFKDHLQMRVDGDSADKLNLTKQWSNSTDQGWLVNSKPLTLGSEGTYTVYYNDALKLDLFVQSAVHVTLI